MPEIAEPVGPSSPNHASDVRTVQSLLNRNLHLIVPLKALKIDGHFGPATASAITTFQTRVVRLPRPDGVVSPKGATIRALAAHAGATKPKPASAKVGSGFSEDEFVDIARVLKCEVAAVKAVVATEIGVRSPLDGQGRPTILFERHYFSRITGGKFDASHPDLSAPTAYGPGKYGRFDEQYGKLERAMGLDNNAAPRSASWGAFQIMGDNFQHAGFSSVEDFVAAMKTIKGQARAFVNFVTDNPALTKALRQKDWTAFAKIYNGPGYAAYAYDATMKKNYEKFRDEK